MNRIKAAMLAPVIAFAAVYLPDVGRGFRKDDFAWLVESGVENWSGVVELFGIARGFYRPVVSVSFAINRWMFDLEPFGYGLSNLAMIVACAIGVYALARNLGTPASFAFYGSAIWALNPHGISMAALWISGRTSLLLTLFSLLAATLFVQKRIILSTLLFALALFSKEEAILLPVVFFAWSCVRTEDSGSWSSRGREALTRVWPFVIPLALYLVMRSRSDAMLPWSAPDFYRPTMELSHLLKNVLEYFDRACTIAIAPVLLLAISLRTIPRPSRQEWQVIALGVAWLVGGFGLTVFVPARSSLYACFPSVGSALAGAAAVSALWRASDERRKNRILVAAVVVSFLMIPLLRSRNDGMVLEADLSRGVLEVLVEASEEIRHRGLVLHDDRGGEVDLAGAFGTLLPEAVELYLGAPVRCWIQPPPSNWELSALQKPRPGESRVEFTLREGRLARGGPADRGRRALDRSSAIASARDGPSMFKRGPSPD